MSRAVVDQIKGPTTDCDWIEFGEFAVGENDTPVSVCGFFEGTRFGLGSQINADQMDLAVPNGWTPEQTQGLVFSSDDEFDDNFEFLYNEDGLDVFWDRKNDKKVYLPHNSKN